MRDLRQLKEQQEYCDNGHLKAISTTAKPLMVFTVRTFLALHDHIVLHLNQSVSFEVDVINIPKLLWFGIHFQVEAGFVVCVKRGGQL